MIKWIFCLTGICISAVTSAQIYLHVDGGMMNYGGDLQNKLFTFKQSNSSLGFGLMYGVNDRISIDVSATFGKVSASDAKNTDNKKRNLSFYSAISEGSITGRFNLVAMPSQSRWSPYALAGISVFHFNPYAFDPSANKVYLQPLGTEGQGLPQYADRRFYKLTQFAVPLGGGVNYMLSDNVMIGGEISFRKLFTDYVDDVSSDRYADTAVLRAARGNLAAKMSYRSDETPNPQPFTLNLQRGNPARKDVFYTAVLKLYISLDAFRGSGGSFSKGVRRQTGCPVKVQ